MTSAETHCGLLPGTDRFHRPKFGYFVPWQAILKRVIRGKDEVLDDCRLLGNNREQAARADNWRDSPVH